MDNEQEGSRVAELPAGANGAVRPTVEEAKATAGGVKSVGKPGLGRGVKPGAKRGTYTPKNKDVAAKSEVEVAPAPPPFVWEKKDVALILSSPFTFGYALGGPDHVHWRDAAEKLEGGQCYEKMAYVVNRLGITDPLYLILAVGIVEYVGVVGQCVSKSVNVRRAKKAEQEKQEAAAKTVGVV